MIQSKQADLQPTTLPSTGGNQTLLFPIGTILATMANSAPTGWLMCDGTGIPSGSELATLLGSTVTPNLTGRTLIGTGNLTTSTINAEQEDGMTPNFAFPSSLTYLPSGYTGGEYRHTLSLPEMPCHQHYGWGDCDPDNGNDPNNDNGPWGFGRSNGNPSNDTDDKTWFGAGANDSDNYLYGSTFTGGYVNPDGTTDQIPTTHGPAGTVITDTNAHLTMQPYYAVNYIIFAGRL